LINVGGSRNPFRECPGALEKKRVESWQEWHDVFPSRDSLGSWNIKFPTEFVTLEGAFVVDTPSQIRWRTSGSSDALAAKVECAAIAHANGIARMEVVFATMYPERIILE
jgi:hypothetical protein